LSAFATFLTRAKDYQANGHVSVPTPGEQQVKTLGEILERLYASADEIPTLQNEAAAALQAIAARAGLKGKLSADQKWAEARALQARLAPLRAALFELAARVNSPEAYDEPVVRDGIARFADRIDVGSLKALAAEQGIKVSAKSQSAKVVSDMLAKRSGHKPLKASPKSKAAIVDPAVVEEYARRLAAMIDRSVDPSAISQTDVEAELSRLKELSPATLFEIVIRVGIREARPSEKKPALLNRVRNELTAARRARERAEV